MKLHLLLHSIVLGFLLTFGFVHMRNSDDHLSQPSFQSIVIFGFAIAAATFGIWKTALYTRSVSNGSEITVTTAEAKYFPYMLYFACLFLGIIRLLT